MQRHRHYGIEFLTRKARVFESLSQNPAKSFHNPNFTTVFKPVDQFANDAAAAHNGNRALKVKRDPSAVWALELSRDSIKWLRATLATWNLDEFDGGRAHRAEILPGCDLHRATGAMRGKAKGEEGFKKCVRHSEGKSKQGRSSQEERKPEGGRLARHHSPHWDQPMARECLVAWGGTGQQAEAIAGQRSIRHGVQSG